MKPPLKSRVLICVGVCVLITLLQTSCKHPEADRAIGGCSITFAKYSMATNNVLQTAPDSPIRIKILQLDPTKKSALFEIRNVQEGKSVTGWVTEGESVKFAPWFWRRCRRAVESVK
jgi:hypothetical protein